MEKNEIVPLKITGLTSEGSGIARCDGKAVFVPFTAVGDEISARILKDCKSYAYAKIESILKPSADRIENDCPAFGKCGGCVYRHISYDAELRAKESVVRDAFERIGKLSAEFLPIEHGDAAERYRNKLQMPAARVDGVISAGFFAPRSHRLIPVSDCKLQPKIFSEITSFITTEASSLHISAYNEEKHDGVLRHIFLRKAANKADGGLCCVLAARRNVPEFRALARKISERFPEVTGVVLNINPEKTNVILGEKDILLCGKAEIFDEMCGVLLKISPKSFYQVNTNAAEKLYKKAAEFAGNAEVILDLYCGTGAVGLSMAKNAKKLIGAEIVDEAVENARENALNCGITNAEFIAADAGIAAETLHKRGISPDVILLDPPRKGCDEATLTACAQMNPQKIVMISCNAATAARDCKFLYENGFSLEKVQPFDLFPRTQHVECISLLVRK